MKFSDIPKFTRQAHYHVNKSWRYLVEEVEESESEEKLAPFNRNPDFHRGHVWTVEQQIAYVEFKLRGGTGANNILCNCPGWMGDFRGPYVLVDGKQRLEAAMKFLKNELPVFDGHYYKDFEDEPNSSLDFIWHVNDLSTREEVLTGIWSLIQAVPHILQKS